ncbi:hypothetical protein CYMTET_25833, partial [Cymbomonas tetramitiformis]
GGARWSAELHILKVTSVRYTSNIFLAIASPWDVKGSGKSMAKLTQELMRFFKGMVEYLEEVSQYASRRRPFPPPTVWRPTRSAWGGRLPGCRLAEQARRECVSPMMIRSICLCTNDHDSEDSQQPE